MGLNGTQHLMKAAGIDPENPIGSIIEKLGIDPELIRTLAEGLPKLLQSVAERQERVETKLDLILAKLEELPKEDGSIGQDVEDVLDSFHLRNLGEPLPELPDPTPREVPENAEAVSTH